MASDFLPIVIAQLWQVTALVVIVATANRWLSRNRPHLAHVLWLVVLLKCLTPPVWSSPGGVFCWLQPQRIVIDDAVAIEWEVVEWQALLATDASVNESGDQFDPVLLTDSEAAEQFPDDAPAVTPERWGWLPGVLLKLWLSATGAALLIVAVRWTRFWKTLSAAPQRACPELEELVASLSLKLGIRRRVRLIVTESRIGPAVVGLFRLTILLPAVVVERLNSRVGSTGCEQRAAEAALRMEPVLAHELLHVRRGDLWVGLLQTLAQSVWWFHPLVWWLGRVTTREAERCCDEEVLAELKCDPAAYARSLLDVLELKSQLVPVPVFPGVRPVEVTTQRLERIMTLGQGCRRRTPLWCWLIALGAAALALPGAAFVVTAQDEQSQDRFADPLPAQPAPLRDGLPGPATPQFNVRTPSDRDDAVTTVVYDVGEFAHLLTGSESERRSKFERLVHSRQQASGAQVNWFDGKPVVKTTNAGHLAVRQCLTLFVENEVDSKTFDEFLDSVARSPETVLVCHLQLITASDDAYSQLEDAVLEHAAEPENAFSWVIPAEKWEAARKAVPHDDSYCLVSPEIVLINGSTAQVEGVAQHPISLKREDDGSLMPCMNWSGWKFHALPFQRADGSFWLGMWFESGTVVGQQELSNEQSRQLGTTGPLTVHHYRQVNLAASLKDNEVVVLPGFDINHGNGPTQSTLLTVRVRRLPDTPPADAVPSPQAVTGIGVNSDAGLTGRITLTTAKTVTPADPVAIPEPAAAQPFPIRRTMGPVTLDVEQRGDGTQSPKLIVRATTAAGRSVFVGTADAFAVRDSAGAISVKLSKARLLVPIPGGHRLGADELWLSTRGKTNNLPESSIRLELETASAWMNSADGATSRLRANRVNLVLNVETSRFEELDAEGLDAEGLDSLKAAAPVAVNDERLEILSEQSPSRESVLQQRARAAGESLELTRTRFTLETRVSVQFEDRPLSELLDWARETGDLNLVVDQNGLEEVGVLLTTPINVKLADVRLNSVLRLVLEPLNLGFKIDDESGVVVVTSRLRGQGGLITSAYPVADLVVPIPGQVSIATDGAGTLTAGPTEATRDDARTALKLSVWTAVAAPLPATPRTTDFDCETLTELITTTIDPDSWSEAGGPGMIRSNATTLSLVIRQTQAVHDEIVDLLGQLRRLRDVQVTLQLGSLDVPPSFLAGLEASLKFEPFGKLATQQYARIPQALAEQIRNTGKVEQAPNVTLFNGQLCHWLFAGQNGKRPELRLQAVASGDRRTIRLAASTGHADSAEQLTALPAISSGDSILFDMSASTDAAAPVVGTPVAGQSRVLQRVPEPRRLVLVQARVLVTEEEKAEGAAVRETGSQPE